MEKSTVEQSLDASIKDGASYNVMVGLGELYVGACAISGGSFYNPTTVRFPSDYVGDYFFCDYCGNWIGRAVSAPTSTSLPAASVAPL